MSRKSAPVPYTGQMYVLEYDPQQFTRERADGEAAAIEKRLGVPVIALPSGQVRLRGDL